MIIGFVSIEKSKFFHVYFLPDDDVDADCSFDVGHMVDLDRNSHC